METTTLKKSFKVLTLKATAFPEGIQQMHNQLKDMVTDHKNRSIYGISYPDSSGKIQYWAACSEIDPEEEKNFNTETFTVKNGAFLAIVLKDWKNNLNKIREVFHQLTADPRIDKNGYCLEEHVNDNTLRCMVPLSTEHYNAEKELDTLITHIQTTFQNLYEALSLFSEEEFNKIPFQGSWTAGQTTEHILRCGGGIPDEDTVTANRFQNEKIVPIKELFLNFDVKFQADPFLAPSEPPHGKEMLFHSLKGAESNLLTIAKNTELEALCLDMELPAFGHLTRYEWLEFILFHTQRHTRQILNIYRKL